jgi:hypothetical protein
MNVDIGLVSEVTVCASPIVEPSLQYVAAWGDVFGEKKCNADEIFLLFVCVVHDRCFFN